MSYYFTNECVPNAYWLATGSNDIIGEMLMSVDEDTYSALQLLLQGKSVTTYIDINVIYPQIKDNPSSVFSFLLVAGYKFVAKTHRLAYGMKATFL